VNEAIKYIHREPSRDGSTSVLENFSLKEAEKALNYHKSFPEYKETPLVELKELAANLGIAKFYVKDESYRFGVNTFKVLGGSYCIGRYIAKRSGTDIVKMPFPILSSDAVKRELGPVTYVTATDGNHGRGIAWTARKLGQKSVVYMPKGTAIERLNNIRMLGADVSITEFNYDDTVRYAREMAVKNGWVLVQDTSWDGYEEIPTWIMQGYLTMGMEIVQQLGNTVPTHIFLQAGVGAMSGAMTGFFSNYYKDSSLVITIVEPNKADCIYQTAEANDGKLHCVKGPMNTIMAGLACGVPCGIGWNCLRPYVQNYVSMPDYVAAKGLRVLGDPISPDPRVISGESGAAGVGLVVEAMR
jgi:diaminopropionate ammonia-lyase